MFFGRRGFLIAVSLLTLCGSQAIANDRASGEEPLLTLVSGPVGAEKEIKSFTSADLDALPQLSFDTSTIWTVGVHRYSGPSLWSIFDAAGIEGGSIKLFAINDYSISIRFDEVTKDYPLVATHLDGKSFGVRDKGPLWVIYPYDSDPTFRTESIYAQSVWQLVKISINPD